MTQSSALAGVRILELGHGFGYVVPYATRLLADLGAEVIVVEQADGHPLRTAGAATADQAIAKHMFEVLGSGKKSVCFASPETSELRELIASADVVVDGLGVGQLRALGFDDEQLRGSRSEAVVVHVSNWGDSGPYRDLPATGLVLQAAAGWVTTRHEPGLPFVQVGGQMHEWVAGSYVAAAVMTGRAWARRSGESVTADFSIFECIHSTIPYTRLMADTNAELGLGARPTVFTPFGVRPCSDGWVGINILTGQQWVDACLMTELGEFTDVQQELGRGEGDLVEFQTRLLNWLSDKSVNEVVDLGQALRIPVVPVATGASVSALPQWQDREFYLDVDSDSGGFSRPGPPWRLSQTPAFGARPAPGIGQHTTEVLDGLRRRAGDVR